MDKKFFYIIIFMLSVVLLYIFFSAEEDISQTKVIVDKTEINDSVITPKKVILKHEEVNKKNIEVKLEDNVDPEQIKEIYNVKTIYSTQTADHKLTISFTSDKNISSKPIQKRYDSGIVINENIIIYGKIDDNLSYRMLFGKNIVDNVNDITFVLYNNDTKEKQEIAPTFLYAIDKGGRI